MKLGFLSLILLTALSLSNSYAQEDNYCETPQEAKQLESGWCFVEFMPFTKSNQKYELSGKWYAGSGFDGFVYGQFFSDRLTDLDGEVEVFALFKDGAEKQMLIKYKETYAASYDMIDQKVVSFKGNSSSIRCTSKNKICHYINPAGYEYYGIKLKEKLNIVNFFHSGMDGKFKIKNNGIHHGKTLYPNENLIFCNKTIRRFVGQMNSVSNFIRINSSYTPVGFYSGTGYTSSGEEVYFNQGVERCASGTYRTVTGILSAGLTEGLDKLANKRSRDNFNKLKAIADIDPSFKLFSTSFAMKTELFASLPAVALSAYNEREKEKKEALKQLKINEEREKARKLALEKKRIAEERAAEKARLARVEAEKKARQAREKERIAREKERIAREKKEKALAEAEAKLVLEKLYHVSQGSGFLVTSDGYAITNNHVVDSCQENKVHINGNIYKTKVIAVDKVNDLALLETELLSDDFFPISQEQPKLMQEVFVGGYPITGATNDAIKVTKGIVSSLAGFNNDYGSFMLDAALQPGNSGGPIFNNDGELIGVATSSISKKFSDDAGFSPQNVNFGVKAQTLNVFLESNNIKTSKSSWFFSPSNDVLLQKATFYLSCWMDIPTMKKMRDSNPEKLMFKLPID